jgi:thiol-disulfide isomerase/thioredoxin
MKRIIVFIALFALLIGIAQAEDYKMTMTTIEGKAMNITGTKEGLVFDDFKGKIIFLEFFGHKCPPCLKSIPHYIDLQTKYKDKLAIIAVEVQGMDEAALRDFVKTKGINYPTISYEKSGDMVPYISQRAQWEGAIPFLVVLDQKGAVQLVQPGMLPQDALEEVIAKLSK